MHKKATNRKGSIRALSINPSVNHSIFITPNHESFPHGLGNTAQTCQNSYIFTPFYHNNPEDEIMQAKGGHIILFYISFLRTRIKSL